MLNVLNVGPELWMGNIGVAKQPLPSSSIIDISSQTPFIQMCEIYLFGVRKKCKRLQCTCHVKPPALDPSLNNRIICLT